MRANACYANSELQFLAAVDLQTNYSIEWDGDGDGKSSGLRDAAKSCLALLNDGTRALKLGDTEALRKAMFNADYRSQQDADEALTKILNALSVSRDLDVNPAGLQNALTDGSLSQKLPSNMHFLVRQTVTLNDGTTRSALDLQPVLILNIGSEQPVAMGNLVSGTWDYACPDTEDSDEKDVHRKTVRRVRETTRFEGQPPSRLIVQLKRFQIALRDVPPVIEKINTPVTGADVLTIPAVEMPYNLQAFICHDGTSSAGGHYRGIREATGGLVRD